MTAPPLRRQLYLDAGDSGSPTGLLRRRVLNPLLVEAFPAWFSHQVMDESRHSRNHSEKTSAKQLQNTGMYTTRREKDNPFLRRNASWLNMHVADPPVRSVALHRIRFVQPIKEKSFAHRVYFPVGMRMMHLYLLTLPEGVSLEDMHAGFQVLWAPSTEDGLPSRIRSSHAAAAHRVGMTFPPQVHGNAERCFERIGEMGAELLVQTTIAYIVLENDIWTRSLRELWNQCGLGFFREEFGDEMKPYQHGELLLADTISSFSMIVGDVIKA